MRHRAAVLLVLVALGATAVLTQPPASAGEWSKLGLSRHGKNFTSNLTMPLFTGDFVWVPGCAPGRTFFVRNQSGEKAKLEVSVLTRDSTQWLRSERFQMTYRAGDKSWTRIRSGGQASFTMLVKAAEVVPVSVRIILLNNAKNKTMNQHLTFTVRVRLSQRTS
jgi:hypothetical protein